MARLRSRKQRHTDEPVQQTDIPIESRKRPFIDEASQDGHQVKRRKQVARRVPSSRYPPEFWDRLSEVPLIHSALEELNRRSRTRPFCTTTSTELSQASNPIVTTELARFARHGGPDLRDLRGYRPAANTHQDAMSFSSRSRVAGSTNPTTISTTSQTSKTKSTTPYNRGFEQHLTDHAIYPLYQSRKPDLVEAKAALILPRPSLSPSRFSEGAFESFQDSNAQAKDEDDVMAHVVPAILGSRRTDHPSAMNTVFGNLEPLTDGTLAPTKPDLYYGAYPEQLDRSIRDELAGHIIPSTTKDKPMVPNFFLEVKGPDGSAAVATRQARYDGAIGSRGIHSLRNYGGEDPQYDDQAYAFSSTYHDGTLKLYAHHVTTPTTDRGRPEYHMTQAGAYAMTHTRDTFVEGATAFRNLRDLAKRHRDGFIKAANTKAAQAAATTAAGVQEHLSSASHRLNDSMDPLAYIALQNADDALQQHIAAGSNDALEDDGEVTTVTRSLYSENDSQETSQESEAPGFDHPSFVSSFASNSASNLSAAKRPRQSPSPPCSSAGSQSSKSRKPPGTGRRTAEQSAFTTQSLRSGRSVLGIQQARKLRPRSRTE